MNERITMHKYITSLLLLFAVSVVSVRGQQQEDLSGIINKMKAINQVQYERVGIGGTPSDNFQNYLDLKSKANTAQLLQLSDNDNGVVACYASWALIDNSFIDLPTILIKFIKNDKMVLTFCGCIVSSDPLSSEFYHRYWNSLSEKATDKTLFILDSLIIYSENCYWLLTTRALENRVYPPSFNERVAYMAFNKLNWDAITYLRKLNNKDYEERLKQATIEYYEETNFRDHGIDVYLEITEELLNYNDEKLKRLIVHKLNKDTFWRLFEKGFSKILLKHGIQVKRHKVRIIVP